MPVETKPSDYLRIIYRRLADIIGDVAAVNVLITAAISDIADVNALVDTAILDIAAVNALVDTAISDIGDVQTVVDLIKTETDKIDLSAVSGLAGISNSLSYHIEEIEWHFHNREKWFGEAGTPSGETHVADRMGPGINPFTITAGNATWGNWVQVLGSSDTPITSGMAKLDAHRFMVTATSSTNPWIIQVITGESADFATKLAAEAFTETPYISGTNNNDSGITDVMSIRVDDGTKVWARGCCIGANAPTIDFYFGIHEYEG